MIWLFQPARVENGPISTASVQSSLWPAVIAACAPSFSPGTLPSLNLKLVTSVDGGPLIQFLLEIIADSPISRMSRPLHILKEPILAFGPIFTLWHATI